MFTVDYTDHEIADDPAQHKQSHVLYLLDAGNGQAILLHYQIIELEQQVLHLWVTGEGAPDFTPSQWTHFQQSHMNPI